MGEIALQAEPIAGAESAQHLVQLARDQRPRRLTAFGQKCGCELLRASRDTSFVLDRSLEVRLTGVIVKPYIKPPAATARAASP
jgi:hypothetical protein